jgi:outer membrane lipoprotein-sorting protein
MTMQERSRPAVGAVVGAMIALTVALSAPPTAALAEGESAAAGGQGVEQAAVTTGEEDKETLDRLIDYLNQIHTLKSRFVQVSSNGTYAEGDLYLDRPGRLRFEYDPPHPALLIANGVTLLYYDRELKQATFLPLWETPLWFLIRDNIDLKEGVELQKIERAAGVIRVTLKLSDDGGEGQVTLVFSDRPVALHSWEIEDAQGILTHVSLVNPQFGAAVDDSLFEHGDLNIHFQDRKNR